LAELNSDQQQHGKRKEKRKEQQTLAKTEIIISALREEMGKKIRRELQKKTGRGDKGPMVGD